MLGAVRDQAGRLGDGCAEYRRSRAAVGGGLAGVERG
jgi:hypothetical protein